MGEDWNRRARRGGTSSRISPGRCVGEGVGGDALEGGSCNSPHFWIGVGERVSQSRYGATGLGAKFAQRLGSSSVNKRWVIAFKSCDQRRDNDVASQPQSTKGSCGLPTQKLIWVAEKRNDCGYRRQGVGAHLPKSIQRTKPIESLRLLVCGDKQQRRQGSMPEPAQRLSGAESNLSGRIICTPCLRPCCELAEEFKGRWVLAVKRLEGEHRARRSEAVPVTDREPEWKFDQYRVDGRVAHLVGRVVLILNPLQKKRHSVGANRCDCLFGGSGSVGGVAQPGDPIAKRPAFVVRLVLMGEQSKKYDEQGRRPEKNEPCSALPRHVDMMEGLDA